MSELESIQMDVVKGDERAVRLDSDFEATTVGELAKRSPVVLEMLRNLDEKSPEVSSLVNLESGD